MKKKGAKKMERSVSSIDELNVKVNEMINKGNKNRHISFLIKLIILVFCISLFSIFIGPWSNTVDLPSLPLLDKSPYSTKETIETYKEAVVSIEGVGMKATGFNISEEGLIVTTKNVIEGIDKIIVSFGNGQFYQGHVLKVHPDVDLALIVVDSPGNLPYLPLDNKQNAQLGDHVFIIGNSYVMEGEISYIGDQEIQLKADVQEGFIGSPVIDEQGDTIGVNFSETTDGDKTAFAVPIGFVLDILDR